MTVAVRTTYGWSADGKSAAEISSDIQHTRYRLGADLRELESRVLVPARLVRLLIPVALAGLTYLIQRLRRRR
jgi:Protein of unknown function (DUF3618)